MFIDDRDQSISLVLGENPCIAAHKLVQQIRLQIITMLFAKYQDEITTGRYGSRGGIQSCASTISFAWTGTRREVGIGQVNPLGQRKAFDIKVHSGNCQCWK